MQRQADDPTTAIAAFRISNAATSLHPQALSLDINQVPLDADISTHPVGCQCPACIAYALEKEAKNHQPDGANGVAAAHGADAPTPTPAAAASPVAATAGHAAPTPAFATVSTTAFGPDSHGLGGTAAHLDAPPAHLGDHLIAL